MNPANCRLFGGGRMGCIMAAQADYQSAIQPVARLRYGSWESKSGDPRLGCATYSRLSGQRDRRGRFALARVGLSRVRESHYGRQVFWIGGGCRYAKAAEDCRSPRRWRARRKSLNSSGGWAYCTRWLRLARISARGSFSTGGGLRVCLVWPPRPVTSLFPQKSCALPAKWSSVATRWPNGLDGDFLSKKQVENTLCNGLYRFLTVFNDLRRKKFIFRRAACWGRRGWAVNSDKMARKGVLLNI